MADELVNGTAGADTLVITATGVNSGSYSLNGGAAVAFTGATSFTFNGLGDNDILQIINPAGDLFAPINGITYEGGGQAGDTLEILGGTALFGDYSIGLSGTDTLRHSEAFDVQLIQLTSGTSVTQTVTEASFTINGSANADTMTVTDGGLVGGQQTWTVDSPTFGSVRFANAAEAIVNGSSGADTVSLDAANTAAGLTTLRIQGVDTVSQTQAISVANLIISAAGDVILTDANDVDTFSADIDGLGEIVELRDSDGFTVAGIATNGGAVTLATDAGDIAIGTATANTGIDTGLGHFVRLQATTGFVTQSANGAIVGVLLGIRAQEGVTLADASNDVDQLTIVSTQGDVDYRDVDDVVIFSVGSSSVFTTLTPGVSSGGNDIHLLVGGNLLLNDKLDSGIGDLRIVAGGIVSQANAGNTLIGGAVGIIAGGAVTLALGDNSASTLAISAAGAVEFKDAFGPHLTIGSVAAVAGTGFTGATGITSGNNNVNLQTNNSLFLAQDINAGTGDVRLIASSVSNALGGGIVANELGIIAANGVEIEGAGTDVNTLAVSASAGAATFENSGALTIGTVAAGGNAGFTGATGLSAGNTINVSASSPLTVANDVITTVGDLTLTAGDSSAVGDNLTLNAGTTVSANGGNVVLRAGDNLVLAGQVTANGGAGTLTGAIDFGNADAGTGGAATFTGSISAASRSLSGESDADSIIGSSGADTINGGLGADTQSGGAGDDVFEIGEFFFAAGESIDGGADTDTLLLGGTTNFTIGTLQSIEALHFSNAGTATFNGTQIGAGQIAAISGSVGANAIVVNAISDVDLSALTFTSWTSGGDTITINGTADGETLTGSSRNDTINGGAGDDTAAFSGNRSSYTLQVIGSNLVIAGLDGTDTLSSIERLQFADGTVNLEDGDPLFDTPFYLSQNPDVFYAGIDALAHFNTFGFHEGRDPNAFFDTAGYLAVNTDVAAAGVNPLEHFHQFGWKEGRDPSAGFDTRLYLINNPDVAAAHVDPLQHFLQHGLAEHRQAFAAIGQSISGGFDFEFYLLNNPDVAAAGIDALIHFNTVGWHEGRNPNAWFDTAGYLSHYTDVAAAGINPLQHYETVGWIEGRDPSATFDTLGYLAANADVAAAHINPLDHFLKFGIYEGRAAINDGAFF
jgi:hypothetical protein